MIGNSIFAAGETNINYKQIKWRSKNEEINMDKAQQGLANGICRVSVFINEVLLEHSHIYYIFSLVAISVLR